MEPPAPSAADPSGPVLLIEAGRAEQNYWRDLLRYRDLFWFLAWRDIAVRYKQTLIGVAWALVQPCVTVIVFTAFGSIAKIPTGGTPRAILVFAALLPWQFFASALNAAGGSMLANAQLVTKVYFPRLIIPGSAIITAFVDFVIAFAFYLVLAGVSSSWPDWRILLLPGFILLAMVVALGAGLWITALNVKYRDFRFVLPFVLQLGLYVSPVAFPSSMVPARWIGWFQANPMVGVIDGFRWCLLRGTVPLDPRGLIIAVLAAGALLGSGLLYFRRTERRFADFI